MYEFTHLEIKKNSENKKPNFLCSNIIVPVCTTSYT